MTKNKNFEKELPENYRLILHINATNAKFGFLFNLIAMVVFIFSAIVAFLPIIKNDAFGEITDILSNSETFSFPMYLLVFIFAILVYVLLHELTHGAFYKLFIGEKLSFGMSWSCFYCGVPNIFVYRRAAIISVAAPLIIFTVVLIPLTACLYYVNLVLYLISALIFGLHLGGCAGDIYVFLLLLFKFKDKRTLVRDTGPEQFFYIPERISN